MSNARRISLVLVYVLIITVSCVLASGGSEKTIKKVVAQVLDDYAKEKIAAERRYQKSLQPHIEKLGKVKNRRISSAGKRAKTRLERIIKDAERTKSELDVAIARDALKKLDKTIPTAVALPKLDRMFSTFNKHKYIIIKKLSLTVYIII